MGRESGIARVIGLSRPFFLRTFSGDYIDTHSTGYPLLLDRHLERPMYLGSALSSDIS